MPEWLIPILILVVLIAGSGTLVAVGRYRASLERIPSLAGMRSDTATSTLKAAGLDPKVTSKRFSVNVPEGSIIAQSPATGQLVKPGTRISLIISGGADTIVIPDIVGMRLSDVQARLEDLGLKVAVERVTSSKVRGTVLESFPASGSRARTGDTIRLSVAGQAADTGELLPYDLQGINIAIDPAPAATGTVDVANDVTRRLRALFEASGAKVVVSRSVSTSSTAIDPRASALSSPTPDTLLGIDTGTQAGVQAVCLPSNDASMAAISLAMGEAFTTFAQLPGVSVNPHRVAVDPVLGRFAQPGMRIMLGSWKNSADASSLTDPDWVDSIARAIYSAVGSTLKPR